MIGKLSYGKFALIGLLIGFSQAAFSQVTDSLKTDSTLLIVPNPADSVLRISNLNPYFTLHVDSSLEYQLDINRDQSRYY